MYFKTDIRGSPCDWTHKSEWARELLIKVEAITGLDIGGITNAWREGVVSVEEGGGEWREGVVSVEGGGGECGGGGRWAMTLCTIFFKMTTFVNILILCREIQYLLHIIEDTNDTMENKFNRI